MPDKQVFEYALIRFVPRVEREEFLNVGVILFCKRKKYLQVKYHIDAKRLSALGEHIDLEQLATYLQSWEWISQGKREGGVIATLDLPSRFRWLAATRSTIIQSSKIHPGLTDDPDAVLNRLFEKYVL
ncbi:MAG: DUF3037 domain-containing protein [Bacteroidia bacterium]